LFVVCSGFPVMVTQLQRGNITISEAEINCFVITCDIDSNCIYHDTELSEYSGTIVIWSWFSGLMCISDFLWYLWDWGGMEWPVILKLQF